ncbi:MAG: nitronate monooxygenase, partial [Chloroflexota bacterium]|nr:nitronate monooxygenase [Chloroflexota bacterium]
MFKTRITEMLGIQYPIIQGGMQWLSRAELAAAVSNAGGLGIITSMTFEDKTAFRQELRKAKSLTKKPFGVNINLFPSVRPVSNEQYIDILI